MHKALVFAALLTLFGCTPPARWRQPHGTYRGETINGVTLPMQFHRKLWDEPGITAHSSGVPSEWQFAAISTLSTRRWLNGPCYLAYQYRFTDDEIARLTIRELCAEIELATCWNDTFYMRRLNRSLVARFIASDVAKSPIYAQAFAAGRLVAVSASDRDAYKSGTPKLGMTPTEVRAATMLSTCARSSKDDAIGTHITEVFCASAVAPGWPNVQYEDATGMQWWLASCLTRHTMTLIPIASFEYIQRKSDEEPRLVWWEAENGGFAARRAGMVQWREALLREDPTLFTPEPPR